MSMETKDISTVNLNAATLDGKRNGEVMAKGLATAAAVTVGVSVAQAKDNVLDAARGSVFGNVVRVGANMIENWNKPDVITVASSSYSLINVTPQYDGDRYAQFLLFHYASNNPKLIGRDNSEWTSLRTFAFLDDNVASSQKLQDSQGVYVDRAIWNALVARVAALENK